jgi:hypothetical protein
LRSPASTRASVPGGTDMIEATFSSTAELAVGILLAAAVLIVFFV